MTDVTIETPQSGPSDEQKPAPYEAWKPGKPAPEPSAEDLAKTPNSVRAFYDRRHHELMQGVEKYRGIAEPVAKFHDMAIQSGTTLDKALDAYVGIETAWRQNPAMGFIAVADNMGMTPAALWDVVVTGDHNLAHFARVNPFRGMVFNVQ